MSSSQKEPMIVRWKDNIVEIGAGRPVVIQSMTNTDTADVESSTKQVLELALAGSELVRLTVNTPAAAKAIPEIRRRLDETGCFVPLVGDFHYNGRSIGNALRRSLNIESIPATSEKATSRKKTSAQWLSSRRSTTNRSESASTGARSTKICWPA